MARALADAYPDAHCELDFGNPLELLVATILSAQCTDKRVNEVTPALFARYRTAADYAGAERSELEEMIRSTERGILVTRLWYNRLVDPADLIVTGLTRDGTFLIEDGRIARATRNFRINQSLRAMLNQAVALSPAMRTDSGIVAPAMKVEGFNFSAVVPREP